MKNLKLKTEINYKMKNKKHLKENLIQLRKELGFDFYDFVKTFSKRG